MDAANVLQAVTARPGARFGPTGIRQGSRRMSADWGWSIYTGTACENVIYISHPVDTEQYPIPRSKFVRKLGNNPGLRRRSSHVP